MALLTLHKVAKAYDPVRPLFADLSLVIGEGERVGLIGANGSGKSTLLKLMAGLEVADAGERVLRRGLRIGYLEQEPQLDPSLSIREAVRLGLAGRDALLAEIDEVYEAMSAHPSPNASRLEFLAERVEELQHRLDRMGGHDVEYLVAAAIDGVGLPDPDGSCRALSGGEARRVALARLLVDAPDLMLLDEPTNHLDAFVIAWLEKRLLEMKVPLVLITHDRYLLDRVVDRIVEIDRGRAYEYPGSYASYVELQAQRLASESKTESVRLQTLKRETAWMRAGVLGRGTKAKARMDRFHELAADDGPGVTKQLALRIPPGPRLGTKVVQWENVRFGYGERTLLPGIDLHLEKGMRLGVVGPNGAGKTTLLRLLRGELEPDSGTIEVGPTVRLSSIDQQRSELDNEATVAEEVAGKSDRVKVGERLQHVVSFLDQFLFQGKRKEQKIGSLSGGERGRVLLAKLLLEGGNLLILDEPTNDLDLPTLRALEEALCAFDGAEVIVSHDRFFLDRVATHVLVLDGHGGARMHIGEVSTLLEDMTRERAARGGAAVAAGEMRKQIEIPVPTGSPKKVPPAATKKKLSFQEKKDLAALEAAIEEAEERKHAIDAKLADPKIYQQGGAMAGKLQKERKALLQQLEGDLKRWEELGKRA